MADQALFQILDPADREVLQMLWTYGPATAHSIHERLHRRRRIAYTTVLSLMRSLHRRGLLTRAAGRWNAYIYTSAVSREELLLRAVEQVCADLAATPTERQRLAEALQA